MLKKLLLLSLFLAVLFAGLLIATRNASFVVRDALLIERSALHVWEILADVGHWSQWWPGVEVARSDSSLQSGTPLQLVFSGNPGTAPARVEDFRKGQVLSFSREGVLGSRVGTVFELDPQADGVLVRVESAITGPQAVLARVTGRQAFADYHRQLLAALQQRAVTYPWPEREPDDGR